MKSTKKALILVLAALIFCNINTSAKDYDYDFDYGMLFGASVSKNLTDRLSAMAELDFWLNDNFTGYERLQPAISLTYTVIPKYLKATVYYTYLNQENTLTGKHDVNRHRYHLRLIGSYATKHVSFSLTTKFEQTHTRGVKSPNNKWRNQLKAVGSISKECPWKPFVSIEIFESMNGRNSLGTTGLERVRYEAGTSYVATPWLTLDMKLRAERQVAKKLLYSSIGLGLKFTIP